MSDIESDDASIAPNLNFITVDTRAQSFHETPLAKKIPPKRMARAGFFYTGNGEKVKCFSCGTVLANWKEGDAPVEKHRQASPNCTFIRCVYPRDSYPVTGEYNEENEDFDFRLRTGAVVDETPTYPKAPHMKSELARLQTFTSWPTSSHMRPCDLAQAGLFYTGQEDHVECFCCSGVLGRWEEGDTAWGEHERHYENCLFVLGHDVGNIPLQGGSQDHQNRGNGVYMDTLEKRIQSFHGVRIPISHERLAQAGFYSTGQGDAVRCFCCGGGVKGWAAGEDPWEEHAKHYPGCHHVVTEKGQEFINSIQLQKKAAATPHQNGFSKDGEENLAKEEEDAQKKLEKLQREKQCKICMDRDLGIVFVPCGHMACCEQCSFELNKCPICCGIIEQKIKTFLS